MMLKLNLISSMVVTIQYLGISLMLILKLFYICLIVTVHHSMVSHCGAVKIFSLNKALGHFILLLARVLKELLAVLCIQVVMLWQRFAISYS